jgi:hypothetical protein
MSFVCVAFPIVHADGLKVVEKYGKSWVEVPGASDPVAIPDTSSLQRAVVVTASDVTLYRVWGAHDYEYMAEGYVTAAQYHYARAEIWHGGAYTIRGSEYWGPGQVTATTSSIYIGDSSAGYTARIFYGD